MKKVLLSVLGLAASAALCSAAPNVETYPNYGFNAFSPNGRYVVSQLYQSYAILDRETGKTYSYEVEVDEVEGTTSSSEYSSSGTSFISNTGMIVGQRDMTVAVYWKDGQWYDLPSGGLESVAYGIQRDGSRIVGAVAPTAGGGIDGLMLIPCYWDVKDDGTYGMPTLLPNPPRDFAGRIPQYVTAISISEDGNTVAGQVQDYSGFVIEPIVYTKNAEGEWEYKLPINSLYHPEGFELPEDPGDSPNTQYENFMTEEEIAAYQKAIDEYYEAQENLVMPEIESYMTAEELLAYWEALDAFENDPENNPFPWPEEYISEEGLAAYNQAVDEYWEAYNALVWPNALDFMTDKEKAAYEEAKRQEEIWDEKWMLFSEAFNELCELVPNQVFNNVGLSTDGKTYYATSAKEYMDWESWNFVSEYIPCVINLETNEYELLDTGGKSLTFTSKTDNGTILAQEPASFETPAANAYIMASGTSMFIPLYDFFLMEDPELAEWMKQNLTHEYETMIVNEETWEYEIVTVEAMFTGMPFTNADMSVLALTVENYWDYDYTGAAAYGYLITDFSAAVKAVEVEKDYAVTGRAGGVVTLKGEFESVTVYDLAGHVAYETKAPATVVNTGLTGGVYVVKAVTKEGEAIISKLLF